MANTLADQFQPLMLHLSLFCISSYIFMASIIKFSQVFLLFSAISAYTFSDYITPNFTASHLQFIDRSGTFLLSPNGTFKAAVFNPGGQTKFYVCVIHAASNTIIWSANHDAPISNSAKMNLTLTGITIVDDEGNLIWSTPPLMSAVSALALTEMGNLILLDQSNFSLWDSFHNPTDTIVTGQMLPVGKLLTSAVSDSDLSTGNYMLTITSSDAILQWHGQTYWKLSMDLKAFKNSNYQVEYMTVNQTGMYLVGSNGTVTVFQVVLPVSNFRIAKLAPSGELILSSFSGSEWKQEFIGPDDACQTPLICGRIGLCTHDPVSSRPICSCPPNFHSSSSNSTGCVPSNGSYTLPLACSGRSNSSSSISYLTLGPHLDYFGNIYSVPLRYGVNLSLCQDLCSRNCSCLGIFYNNSSGSCYVLQDELGSIMSRNGDQNGLLGNIKASVVSSATTYDNDTRSQGHEFPLVALVLLPITGCIILIVAIGLLWWRKRNLSTTKDIKLGKFNSNSSRDMEPFFIPGLPQRFDYQELEKATDNFKTQIGSGGFGTVYKGVLPDNTVVAVKKIINIGIQGKKDFFTEIAVIGNIHHVNLVKLKGFCAQGGERLLVYDYMNRGSLDHALFGGGPVLEWQERLDIALGTARGLAYLHSGCDQKIIHCDIKPENILLHDHFQAKISDFGLSKLLSPEQSGLFTTMRGTRGYLAPEWLTNAAITEKTDVYSFGMVLLELVSGRKNCSPRSQTQSMNVSNSGGGGGHSSASSTTGLVYFPLFALEMHEQGRYLDLADPRLEGRVTVEEVEKLARVALCCVHEEPALRPNMVTVVNMFEGGIPVAQPRIESLNFLRFYGRRFSESSMIAEGNEDDSMIYPLFNNSTSTIRSGSQTGFSYISSQNISGPR